MSRRGPKMPPAPPTEPPKLAGLTHQQAVAELLAIQNALLAHGIDANAVGSNSIAVRQLLTAHAERQGVVRGLQLALEQVTGKPALQAPQPPASKDAPPA